MPCSSFLSTSETRFDHFSSTTELEIITLHSSPLKRLGARQFAETLSSIFVSYSGASSESRHAGDSGVTLMPDDIRTSKDLTSSTYSSKTVLNPRSALLVCGMPPPADSSLIA